MAVLRLGVVVVLLVLSAVILPPAQAHDQLGANLNGIRDYGRDHAFVDLVKQSRLFLKVGQWDDGPLANRAPVGADGWPTSDFRLVAMVAQAGTQALAGSYSIVFQGQANLAVPGGGAGSISGKTYDAATNTTRASLNFPAGGDILAIEFTATGGTVKNLRVLRPGAAAAPALLTAPWSNHAQRFSVLRFMDWTRTNGNRDTTWSSRVTPDKRRTVAYGVPWETVVEVANTLQRDLWINVPVLADDDYVTRLATLLRDGLDPARVVYVEYGNELWNFSLRDDGMDALNGGTAFNGATVNRDLAAASPAGSPLRYDGQTDPTTLGFRRVALRLKQISDIFRGIWGNAAINSRVRPVLAGQMANNYVVAEGLRLLEQGLGVAPSSVIYAIAGAPYVFPSALPDGEADETPGLTSTQILEGLAAGVDGAPAENGAYQYLTHAGLGAWYGLRVLAYEAGFDTFGPNNVQSKRLANLDPRIRSLCRAYVDTWHAHGFGHLMWFNAGADSYDTPYGAWPLVEDMANQAVPKNQCMDDVVAAALPAISIGLPVAGGPVAGGAYSGSTSPSGTLSGGASQFGYPGYVEYLLRADTEGTYGLTFTGSAPSGQSLAVRLNGATVATNLTLPATTGPSQTLTVALRRGLNALRIERAVGNAWSVTSFSFALTGDGTPDAFSFAPRTGVTPGSVVVSDPALITGLEIAAPVTVSGGQYSVGCGSEFTSAAGSITSHQSVCVRHTAAATGSTSTTTTLSLGGVSAGFTSTTAPAPEPPASSYTLTVSRAGAAGSVSSSPSGISCGTRCSASFKTGTTVTLTAKAGRNALFSGWAGDCSGTGKCTLVMSAARTVTANFVSAGKLSVSRRGSGVVTSAAAPGIDCGSDCGELYELGTAVTLQAQAAAGSVFTGWSGACEGTAGCTVSIDAPRKVRATFKLQHGLTVTRAGQGTVSGSPAGIHCGPTCSTVHTEGDTVTLTATPGAGQSFLGWGGACQGTERTCKVRMSGARAVSAAFSGPATAAD